MTKKTNTGKVFALLMLLAMAVGSNTAQAWWWRKTIDFAVLNREAIKQNLVEYKELATLKKQLEAEYADYTQVVLKEQNKLSKELLERYKKEQAGKSGQDQEALLKEYRKKAEELAEPTQEKLDRKQWEIQRKIEQAERETEEKVNNLIAKVAQKEKVRYVVDQTYVYNEAKKDLTPLVIKESRKKK